MKYKYIDISEDWREHPAKVGNTMRKGNPPMRRVKEIDMLVVHCTDDGDRVGEDVWSIIKYHTAPNHVCDTGCWTICYHYYIEDINDKATVWHTVPDNIVTFHAGKWNTRSLGIVVDKKADDIMSEGKYDALVDTLANLCIEYNLNPEIAIVGHRNLYWTGWKIDKHGNFHQNKTCPGALSINKLKEDVMKVLSDKNYLTPVLDVTGKIIKGELYYTMDVYDYISSNYNYILKNDEINSKSNLLRMLKWKTK